MTDANDPNATPQPPGWPPVPPVPSNGTPSYGTPTYGAPTYGAPTSEPPTFSVPEYAAYTAAATPPAPAVPGATNGLAVAALVLGICSAVTAVVCFFLFGLVSMPLAVIGLILGIMGEKRAKELGGKSLGMARAGWILSIVGAVLTILFWAIIIVGSALDSTST